MREILFKAKRLDNGEWVEGYYVERDNKSWIYPAGNQVISKSLARELRPFHSAKSTQRIMKEVFPVDPSTVCQYTGQVDYESEEPIFCDDLLKSQNGMEHIYVVGFENGGYFARERGETGIGTPLTIENIGWLMLKRIGSIHDGEDGQ